MVYLCVTGIQIMKGVHGLLVCNWYTNYLSRTSYVQTLEHIDSDHLLLPSDSSFQTQVCVDSINVTVDENTTHVAL